MAKRVVDLDLDGCIESEVCFHVECIGCGDEEEWSDEDEASGRGAFLSYLNGAGWTYGLYHECIGPLCPNCKGKKGKR